MFALVQFLIDKVTAVVPLTDVKNFQDSTEVDQTRPYEVFWKSPNGEGTGYWYAVILLIAETEKLIEQRKKRVQFPTDKKLEELLAKTLDNRNNNSVVEEIRQKSKEIQEKRQACENDKLKEILKRKLKDQKKRKTHEEKTDKPSKSHKRDHSPSTNESSDEDELVLQSEITTLKRDYKKVLHQMKLKQEENIKLKNKNEELHELNVRLQDQLLSILSTNGSWIGQNPPTQNHPDPQLVTAVENNLGIKTYEEGSLSGKTTPPLGVVTTNNTQLLEKTTPPPTPNTNEKNLVNKGLYLHDNGNIMKWKDEQIELAPGVKLKREQWQNITTSNNLSVSRFTRNLAVSLWGSETLMERSVTGAACRRFKKDGIQAKKALTPIKVDAVQNGLRFWISEYQGKEKEEVLKLSSTAAVRKMLSDKIMDLAKPRKQEKKNINETA